jgi:hypothetical protein
MGDSNVVKDKPRGPFQALLGMLLKPRSTLADLSTARRRWWWLPALLMVVALTLHGVAFASASAADQQRAMEAVFESAPGDMRGASAPPQMSSGVSIVTVIRVGGQVLGTLVTWLIWAGLLYLASTFLGQNGAHFGGFFAMVAWTWLPYSVRNLVQAAYTALSGQAIYNQGLSGLVIDKTPAAPVVSAVSAVSAVRGPLMAPGGALTAPSRGDQVLAALLTRVDIYLIWNLVLITLGVAAFARLKTKKAALGTLVIWAVFTIISLLPTIVGFGQGLGIF